MIFEGKRQKTKKTKRHHMYAGGHQHAERYVFDEEGVLHHIISAGGAP